MNKLMGGAEHGTETNDHETIVSEKVCTHRTQKLVPGTVQRDRN